MKEVVENYKNESLIKFFFKIRLKTNVILKS